MYRLTLLLVNLHLDIHVDAKDEKIADDVESAHAHEDLRIFERNLLRCLHHHEDDDEVGAVIPISVYHFLARAWMIACGAVGHTFEGS